MSSTPSQKITILLVEDSEADVFFFQRALKKTGVACDVILAADGKSAISVLSDPNQEQKLDVVFLDLKLPYLSGFDVLRWSQSQKFAGSLPIIVLSGSPHVKDKKLALELGASEYLVKPISAEILQQYLVPREKSVVGHNGCPH